jgi:hypothetical protein
LIVYGSVSGIRYDQYEQHDWKAAVLFIDGKAQKLDTEKSDGSPLRRRVKRKHVLRLFLVDEGLDIRINQLTVVVLEWIRASITVTLTIFWLCMPETGQH